jgi:hypothetical protein
MLKYCIALSVVALAWGGSVQTAAAEHQRAYEFDGTHVALSIDRFMGIDFTDYEGPGGDHVTARLFLNASEPAPTSFGRFGIDVFIRRLSLGLAAGLTSEDTAIVAPRVGYLFGLTPTIGLWLRGGAFYAAMPGDVSYAGIYGEVLFEYFPYDVVSFHLGPSIDVAFANDNNLDYIAIGLPTMGMTAYF